MYWPQWVSLFPTPQASHTLAWPLSIWSLHPLPSGLAARARQSALRSSIPSWGPTLQVQASVPLRRIPKPQSVQPHRCRIWPGGCASRHCLGPRSLSPLLRSPQAQWFPAPQDPAWLRTGLDDPGFLSCLRMTEGLPGTAWRWGKWKELETQTGLSSAWK